ncbi:MAG: 5-methyltetrahydropteroyltriglutamate--homocysteine S-methyltransferase [Planctomycetota bacterium]|nr:5-methyltetrahydropteroyltriglutamate--homocysteine S-methyltransferase [Planctomycetota bacterium]
MALATNLGFPRIGPARELKKLVESYWSKQLTLDQLRVGAAQLRAANWKLQSGLDHVPAGDFSLYDHVLDTAASLSLVPARFRPALSPAAAIEDNLFALARGLGGPSQSPAGSSQAAGPIGIPAMEMTKWFDTNYHYIVPELEEGVRPVLAWNKPLETFQEAKAAGVNARPVLLGPVSFLLLSKPKSPALDRFALLPDLVAIYRKQLRDLAAAGAAWVQIDEPCLVLDLTPEAKAAYKSTYSSLAGAGTAKLLIATYFGGLRDNLDLALSLPSEALHLDLIRDPDQLLTALERLPAGKSLSLGVVDGRNVWRADLDRALSIAERAADRIGPDRLLIAPSCSLLHAPVDLDLEATLDAEIKSWLSFAVQRVREVVAITRGINQGRSAIASELEASRAATESRRRSTRVHHPQVQARLAGVTPQHYRRASDVAQRRRVQAERLGLPALPTTTIGSFPQTKEVRQARAGFVSGTLSSAAYDQFLRDEITRTIRIQEAIGLDVLVHGEFERNDMVEYFGEQLEGYVSTKLGWVQSYGSRCVKPPLIYGDIRRPRPMTVEWSRFAQSQTDRIMKGMLTGPVTMLQWSFVRDDQPRSETCKQLALVLRDEVSDLEAAGLKAVQVDEPALREGLPLRRSDWAEYLRWAVDCFRLSTASAADATQIHTHMCYSEFNDIIQSIADLDADVLSIENSRSAGELLEVFARFEYPAQIGPGVYDIHSPRVPSVAEVESLIRANLKALRPWQVWVNPDCGLKTRGWDEVKQSLVNVVEATRSVRAALASKQPVG